MVGSFHYAVIGDGEAVIDGLLDALEKGSDPYAVEGVWNPEGETVPAVEPEIPQDVYVENRQSRITRIEIARGCKSRCPFCQLAFTKPYREQPFDAVVSALEKCSTKQVALFAPNRTSYSRLYELDAKVQELGKNNIGSDTRLDMVQKFESIDCVRFGVEAFGERTRRKFHKVPTNNSVIEGILYVAHRLKKPNGKPHKSAVCYVIGDLPGEGSEDVGEFYDMLVELDGKLRERFTLFLSMSAFAPAPFTPMWGCGIHPYADLGSVFARRPHFERLVIATRGGHVPAPARLCQMLTIRGDERAAPVLRWLGSRKGRATFAASGKQAFRAGKTIEATCRKVGFPPEDIYREWDQNEPPPWANTQAIIPYKQRWN